MTDLNSAAWAARSLAGTAAVRQRSEYLLKRARADRSRWLTVHDERLADTADEVATVTRQRYPDLKIPFHSRWRHFEAGGIDRKPTLEAQLGVDPAERARTMIDLTVVSVLLDAGAGPDWQFHEDDTGITLNRSEGLGVASWHAFLDGSFSSDPENPLQVDAAGLANLTTEQLAKAFQASPNNPLVGLDGRVALLHRLGDALAATPHLFGVTARPGGLFDTLTASGSSVAAHDILAVLLASLSGIWLSSNNIDGQPLGDCWRHSDVPGEGLTAGWMPFHKLSQWLTYSLLEPFQWAGIDVHGLDELTGLPEYRNGGLLLDTGVLALRDTQWTARTWTPGNELIVEWRALTVALIDELAPLVRDRLGVDAATMPLACVLEGGTWAAGRATAQRLRGGLPPLAIDSDGTVF